MRRPCVSERQARKRLANLMTAATDPTPEATRAADGAAPDDGHAPPRPHRGRAIATVAVFVLVTVGAALAWQAVGYRRVLADLDAAAAVFDAAREARAREVAPESWQRAVDAMDAAMAELHRQEGRLAPFRSYPRVHALLTGALAAAADARAAAEAAAAAARNGAKGHPQPGADVQTAPATPRLADAHDRARDAVNAARASLERADASLARVSNCPRAMHEIGIRRYVQKAGPTLEAMAAQIGEIDARLAKGDTFGATVAAESLKGKVDPIVKDLDGMATKVRCRKPQ